MASSHFARTRHFWGNLALRRKGLAVVALPLLAILVFTASSLVMWREGREATARVDHTLRVRADIRRAHGLVFEVQSSLRGYLLTGEGHWLEEHERAIVSLEDALRQLGTDVRDNATQTERLERMRPRLTELLDVCKAQVVRATGADGPRPWLAGLIARAHDLRLQVAGALESMANEEERLLDERTARRERLDRATLFGNALAGLIGVLGGLAGSLLFASGVVRRVEQLDANARRLGQGLPLLPRPEGDDEIGRLGIDIERAAALLEERQSESERYASEVSDLYNHAPCGYHSVDAEGVVRRMNDTELSWLGYPREEIEGKVRYMDLMTAASRKLALELFEPFKREGKVASVELSLVRRDGAPLEVLVSGTAVRGPEGEFLSTRTTVVDITERKRAEERVHALNESLERRHREMLQATAEAQRANRLKSEFLANMSHELRTPLNAVIGFAELMHDGKVGPVSADHKEYLGDILTSARHLLQLINDVLDLAKVEAGRLEFRLEAMDPRQAAREVQGMLRTLAAERRVEMAEEHDPGLTSVVTDSGRFKQVLYNYLSNALKFTPEGGRVTIRLRTDGDESFRIEVEDTGVGIEPEDQERLFQEFQQIANERGPRAPGTGLGLALTRRLVEAQGGRVGFRSTFGRGSVFYAVLPRSPVARSVEPCSSVGLPPGEGGPALLVVEDEDKDRAWLIEILAGAGYAVDTASTAADALTRCQERRYAAILLDLLLPDRSGWDVLHGARRAGPNQRTPVIVVTVVAEQDTGSAFKVDGFLTKPVRPEAILAALLEVGVPPLVPRPILVVDDDPLDLRLMETALQSFGYRAVTRRDGAEGLEAAASDPPAAVVLDLAMPGMDGFEFLARFRETDTGRHVPILVWTGLDLTNDQHDRLRGRAQAVVAKAGGPQRLLEQIRALVRPSAPGAARTGD